MASSSNSKAATEALIPKKHQDAEASPGTTKKQIQSQAKAEKKVPVVYYLSQNGKIEHPHFVEVPLSSPQGLYLRDVVKTLNLLRGQGMGSMFSWASKRSYKNIFLWQDLLDDDLIYPCQGQDYILKGSLLLETSLSFRSNDSISSSTSRHSSEMNSSSIEDSNSPVSRRKKHSCSVDVNDEHRIYKAKTSGELTRNGSNVSTQTDDNQIIQMEAEGLSIKSSSKASGNLESSAKAYRSRKIRNQKVGRDHHNLKMNETKLVMKLIGCGCGSKRFKDFQQMENKY